MDNKIALCDMHVHSRTSHDSSAKVTDTASAAIEKGIFVFAITDHCDIQCADELDVISLVKSSFSEALEAGEIFDGRVKILKGIELGEAIWNMPYAENVLKALPYDVVIGSVHAVRYKGYTDSYSTIDFTEMSHSELDGYLEKYFDEVLEMLEKVDCDIMAHLTCPLRYINGKYGLGVDATKYRGKISNILDCIIKKNIALEINTSGLGTAFDSLMPEKWVIELYKEKGGRLITLGSDAHVSERVGNGFDKTIKLLKACGFDAYYYYEKRKAVRCQI